MAKRTFSFLHEDGEEATIQSLATVFRGSLSLLHEKHTNIYSSVDMKTGISISQLQEHHVMMCGLMRLDPRGGLFAQSHVQAALLETFDKARLLAHAVDAGMQSDEFVGLVAYKIRVVCSHVRNAHDNTVDAEQHPLAAIFCILQDSNASSDSCRVRRSQRLDKRPHPFSAFRVEEPHSSGHEEEPVVVVVRYWNGAMAKQLMSDGLETNADDYEQTAEGFARAVWLWPVHATLALDIPNSRCLDGKIVVAAAPRAPAKKVAKTTCCCTCCCAGRR